MEEPIIPTLGDQPAPAKQSKPGKAAKAAEPAASDKPKTTRIILEEGEEIPPTGLFLSVNGVGYVLKPGEEADVPDFLLEVLDNAKVDIPRTEGDRVVGYKSRSRFPYRVVR